MTQTKKLSERTFTGFLWMLTGGGIQAVLKIGVLAILARLITPEEFGLVGIAVIVVELSKMFTQMGVGPAIVQRKILEERHLTTGFALSLVLGAFLAGIIALVAPLLASFFKMDGLTPVLRVIAFAFFIDASTITGQALLQRNMKFRKIAAVEITSFAIGYGLIGITLGYLKWGIWALVAAHMAQAILHAILLAYTQPFPKLPRFDLQAIKELLYFGGGMTLAKFGNFIANQGDNLVIGRTLGAAALGIYGRAYQFMVMPAALFGTALDKALFPAMAKVQDDKKKLGRAYLAGVSTIGLIAIPLSIIMFLLAPEIVLLLLGPQWIDAIIPFQVLACGLLFRMSYKMSDSLVRATGAVYRRAWRQLLYALLVLAGAYIGQFWGLLGVAAGVAIAVLLNFMLMAQLSIKLSSVTWAELAKAHIPGLLLGALLGMCTYTAITVGRVYLDSHLATLTLAGALTILLLLPTLWYFPNTFINNDVRSLSQGFISKYSKILTVSDTWKNL